jgi:hypothetical protein
MLKFSNISGEKVNSEPKVQISQESLEVESFKQSILDLIEKTLTIRSEGPVYKNAGLIVNKIDGKEMFVEALMDFLSEKENNKAITYLESLKKSNRDWKSIDEKILQIKTETENIKFLTENPEHVEQIKSFLEKYSMSEDFNEILDNHILRVTDFNTANLRSKVAETMLEDTKYFKIPKNRLRTLSYKYAHRANQLK